MCVCSGYIHGRGDCGGRGDECVGKRGGGRGGRFGGERGGEHCEKCGGVLRTAVAVRVVESAAASVAAGVAASAAARAKAGRAAEAVRAVSRVAASAAAGARRCVAAGVGAVELESAAASAAASVAARSVSHAVCRRASVVHLRRWRCKFGVAVVVRPGVRCWIVMCATVVCCARAMRRVAVCSGPGVLTVPRVWWQGQRVAVAGNAGDSWGRRRGQVGCDGTRGVRVPDASGVRRCAVYVCHVLDAEFVRVQGCADCGFGRARGGDLVGAFEHVNRNGRENVRGVRRRALRGGGGDAEELEDDESAYLHRRSR